MKDNWWIDPSQMDEDQKNIVSLPKENSYLIKGSPGSGKTNLLLLRAKYLSNAGKPDFQIIVFTKTLKEYLSFGCVKYSIDPDKVITFNRWAQGVLGYYQIRYERYSDFIIQRKHYIEKLKELIATDKIERKFDCILLDEAQDYWPDEIEILNGFCDVLFAVADSQQKIYSGADPFPVIEASVNSTFPLKYHYRNGLNICKLADDLYKHSIES